MMTELPTFYGWLLKIAGLAVICCIAYLIRLTGEKHPLIDKYILIPLIAVACIAEIIILFII